jgi:hypothetical protein
MAEKQKVNKSQAVRDYLKANPGVGNTEVAASLTKSGIKVSPQYVAKIRSILKDRRAAKKAAKAVASASPADAADGKPRINKTQAVRDFLKANPGIGNIEVADSLAKSGIKVSPNYVAGIKGKVKVRRGRRRKAVKAAVTHHHVGIPEVKAAFALLRLTSGMAQAKAALEAAQELREMI